MKLGIAILISLACLTIGSSLELPSEETHQANTGFPVLTHPEGNEHTEARWLLGKRLFFDPVMSDDASISCASCHAPSKAFSDDVALSIGAEGSLGTQNAPTLTNVGYNPYFTRAGGVPTLELQILVPIQEHNEFNSNILEIADRLKADPTYVSMSAEAYNREPDAFVITRALACFERSLISASSAYDDFSFRGDEDALTKREQKGMMLFFSDRAQCSSCHAGFNFTDHSFKNNGLYAQYADSGRMRLTGLSIDRNLFKVPTLRNISLTAPYMHDGSLRSLEDVIEHYSEGIVDSPQLAKQLEPMRFTPLEKSQLLAFLNALSDLDFLNDERFTESHSEY